MNCFFLSLVVAECAAFHCDKHAVKMILELAQMLYTAHSVNNRSPTWRRKAPENSYKMTHVRHPTAIWARSVPASYRFMAELAKALCTEYTHRYGRTHKTETHINWLLKNQPDFPPPADHDKPPAPAKGKPKPIKPTYFSKTPRLAGMTPIPLAMPDDCLQDDAILAYRDYYIRHKQRFARWTKRDVPEWFTVGIAAYPLPAAAPTAKEDDKKTVVVKKEKASDATSPAKPGKKAKSEEPKASTKRKSSSSDSSSKRPKVSVSSRAEPKKVARKVTPKKETPKLSGKRQVSKASSSVVVKRESRRKASTASSSAKAPSPIVVKREPGLGVSTASTVKRALKRSAAEVAAPAAKRRRTTAQISPDSPNVSDSLMVRRSLRVGHLPPVDMSNGDD